MGSAADNLRTLDVADVAQGGDFGVVLAHSRTQVQLPPSLQVQLIVAGQFDTVGAGVRDVGVEGRALDVRVRGTGENR
ncbi:hypothetical protein D3C80_2057250 [compost metagenome]